VSHVKSKYQNLIHLSNLYSKSFSNLDSLSKIVDEFIADMCKIEIKLATQSLIENVNINADLIRKEHESLQVSPQHFCSPLEVSFFFKFMNCFSGSQIVVQGP